MAILHSPDSEYSKEARRWEGQHTVHGQPGRPYQYYEYPTRMYKAGRKPDGKIAILEAETAQNEHEREALERRGFTYGGQGKAIEAWDAQEATFAQLAAEGNFTERRMSEKAQAEATAAKQAAGARHLPEIPATPIRKLSPWQKRKQREAALKAAAQTQESTDG